MAIAHAPGTKPLLVIPLIMTEEAAKKHVEGYILGIGFEEVSFSHSYGLGKDGWEFDIVADRKVSIATTSIFGEVRAPTLNISKRRGQTAKPVE